MVRALITNDDGPETPLLRPFLEQLDKRGWERIVVIPSQQQSWVSKSLNRHFPVKVNKIREKEYHVSGSPAACVNLGLFHLSEEEIDLVISGPNFGHNAGRSSVLSSGTVGGALEGCIAGKPAIALSFPFFGHPSEKEVEDSVVNGIRVIEMLVENWPSSVDLFNVNVPLGCGENPQVYLTTLWRDSYGSLFEEEEPGIFVQTGGISPSQVRDPPEGTDMWAIVNKYVSITALSAIFTEVDVDLEKLRLENTK